MALTAREPESRLSPTEDLHTGGPEVVPDWRDMVRFDRTTIIFATIVVTLILHRFVRIDLGFEPETRGWWMVWGIQRFFIYTTIPALSMHYLLGLSVRHHTLALPSGGDALKYLAMLGAMIPLVVAVSNLSSFQAKYPYFVATEGIGEMWPWWIAYGLQFFGLEFFFRGFIIHSLKGEIGGRAAIWVMVLPYLMIHFGKPILEAAGSVIAGLILGYLSLKKRSIWLGVVLHVGVAIAMDTASLFQRGAL